MLPGPYDVSLVEGSITTPEDAERIHRVREMSRTLVTIGACATAGGVQALRNFADVDEFRSLVYARPDYVSTLATSTPIAAHVDVDYELHGCPIDRRQLLEVITALLVGRKPEHPARTASASSASSATTSAWSWRTGHPCLGPVTHAGCGALCPAHHRGCYGCFGPMETPNAAAQAGPAARDRHVGGRRDPGLPHLQHRCARVHRAVPGHRRAAAGAAASTCAGCASEDREPVTHRRIGRSTCGRWPGSRARARCTSAYAATRVEDVRLEIYEPPRFFEAFLRGRRHTEPPDITARICGICPVAYQMSACAAIEDACGVTVDGPIADLRRLLYCGEWIESHTLHIYLLHAPDFLGYPSALDLAKDRRDLVERGLALKKAGNEILELLGGRAIHPINVRVGGFYRAPTAPELARAASQAASRAGPGARHGAMGGRLRLPRLPPRPRDARPGDARPVCHRGAATSPPRAASRSRRSEFEDHVIEEQVPHSTALHARLAGRGRYLVGPAARYTLNRQWLSPLARAGRRRRRAGRRLPQPVPQHPGPRGRGGVRGRRGAAPDRRYEPPARPIRGRAAAGRDRLRRHRGAPRRPVPPVRPGRRRPRSPRPASCRPPRRTRPASRTTCAVSSPPGSTWTTNGSPGSASRPSATTTRASPARPTSSTSPSNAREPWRDGGIVIGGVGNEYRRDDGFGPAVVARLAELRRTDHVLSAVDARGERRRADPAARPVDRRRPRRRRGRGTRRRRPRRPPVRTGPRRAGRVGAATAPPAPTASAWAAPWSWRGCSAGCPRRLVVLAVAGGDFGFGTGLTPEVAAAVEPGRRAGVRPRRPAPP